MNLSTDNGARALLDRVEQTAFFAHYSMLGEGNVRQYDWEKLGAKLTGLEKQLWNFFLLGESLPKAEATDVLGAPALKFLQRHKLCATANGKLSLGNLRLVRCWGMPLFVQRGATAFSFVGDDVKSLLAFLPRRSQGRCLSLYTAGGLEVMPLAGTAVELDFVANRADGGILRANLELNATEQGSRAWQFTRRGKGLYDLIVSNPPWLIEPPGSKIPKYAAGGRDGLKHISKFLEATRNQLKPDGLAMASFAFFAEVDRQAMEDRLRAFLAPYDLNYVITVSSKLLMEPGVPIFNQMVSLSVDGSKAPSMEAAVKKNMDYLKRKQIGAAHLVKGRFWRPINGDPREQIITNYSDSYYGTWII